MKLSNEGNKKALEKFELESSKNKDFVDRALDLRKFGSLTEYISYLGPFAAVDGARSRLYKTSILKSEGVLFSGFQFEMLGLKRIKEGFISLADSKHKIYSLIKEGVVTIELNGKPVGSVNLPKELDTKGEIFDAENNSIGQYELPSIGMPLLPNTVTIRIDGNEIKFWIFRTMLNYRVFIENEIINRISDDKKAMLVITALFWLIFLNIR